MVVIALLLLILLTILQSPMRVNPDVSLLMEYGRRTLDGELPYIDFYHQGLLTINYLNAVPVAISEVVGVNSLSVWLLISWILTVSSVFCTFRLSVRIFASHCSSHLNLLIPLCLAIMAWLALFTSDIGQREYLFVLAAIPWLLYRYCKLEGMTFHALPAVIIGIAAGLVATIKPHFLFVIVAVELYWIVRGGGKIRRSVDASLIGFAVVPLANLAYLLVYPDAFDGLYRWMILYFAQGLPNLSASLSTVNVMRLLLPCSVAAIGLILAIRRNCAHYRLLAGLAIFTAASGGIVVLQSLREFYRLLPLYAGALTCCGLIILLPAVIDEPGRRYTRFTGDIFYGCLLSIVLLTTLLSWQSLATISIATPKDLRSMLLEVTKPGDEILFMTQWLGIKHPWLQIVGRNEAHSIPAEWKPPMDPEDERTAESLNFQLDITRADIDESPAAIVIDSGAGIRKVIADSGLLELIESRYRLVGEVQTYSVYAYVGNPPPQGTSFTLGDKFELYSWHIQPVDGVTLQACDQLKLMTWWHPLEQDLERFTLHVDLVKPDGGAVLEQYGRIGTEEDYSAVSTIIDQRQLELPCELESGVYWLLLSMEDMSVAGGDVLPVSDSNGGEYGKYVFLGEFEIGA